MIIAIEALDISKLIGVFLGIIGLTIMTFALFSKGKDNGKSYSLDLSLKGKFILLNAHSPIATRKDIK